MYNDLKNKVEEDRKTIDENHQLHLAGKRESEHLAERMTQAQADIEFLKTLGAPTGDGEDN